MPKFLVGKKLGMSQMFKEDGTVIPITVIEVAPKAKEEKADLSVFTEGEIVKISGVTKGKGFQGVVKRHGFRGMPASHGHFSVVRHAGSIGQRFPQHTLKGMRMAGRMGGKNLTVRGLEIVKIDAEAGMIAVKGAVPGNNKSMVKIQSQPRR